MKFRFRVWWNLTSMFISSISSTWTHMMEALHGLSVIRAFINPFMEELIVYDGILSQRPHLRVLSRGTDRAALRPDVSLCDSALCCAQPAFPDHAVLSRPSWFHSLPLPRAIYQNLNLSCLLNPLSTPPVGNSAWENSSPVKCYSIALLPEPLNGALRHNRIWWRST